MAKVISLTQPWASLVAFGEKHIETRSWLSPHRGILLIHSSKGFPGWARDLCKTNMFLNALMRHGVTSANDLPLGRILAETEMYDCVPTERFTMDPQRQGAIQLTEQEEAFGDFSKKRFGFLLRSTRQLRETIPVSGALGLWDFDDVWSDV